MNLRFQLWTSDRAIIFINSEELLIQLKVIKKGINIRWLTDLLTLWTVYLKLLLKRIVFQIIRNIFE